MPLVKPKKVKPQEVSKPPPQPVPPTINRPPEMSIDDWAMFFELLERLCFLNHPSWEARAREVVEVATMLGEDARLNLEEFIAWFGGEVKYK